MRRYLAKLPRGLCFFVVAVWMIAAPASITDGETQTAVPLEPLNLDEAAEAATNFPRLHSLLISHRGELVVERYYNKTPPAKLANIKSASKSVISALVGIAIGKGLLTDVRAPITGFFPEIGTSYKDSPKIRITVEDLLTMRSGLQTTSNRYYGAWVLSRNWVQYALGRPMVSDPGTEMQYSTGNTHLLSAILTKAARVSTWQFAQDNLARPLGFTLAKWPQDPQGIYFGGNDMLMTPRQMLAFGEMYLRRGRHNGQQVVPEGWVDVSLRAHVQSPREQGRQYGYGWWMRNLGGHQTYYAWGYGGQFIFVVPDLDLVVVTTSASEVSNERRGHLRTIYDLVEHYVVEPVSIRQ